MLLALILACASTTTTPVTPEPAPTPEPSPEPASVVEDGAEAAPAAAGITAVHYHFRDASVPPPHHRSVTVRVSLESVDYVIDSYGDIIGEAHAPGSQETLDKAIAAYEAAKFKPAPSEEPGCTGGTSRSVRVEQGSLIAFAGSMDACGGSEQGLEGDMDGFAAAMKALAPRPEGGGPIGLPVAE